MSGAPAHAVLSSAGTVTAIVLSLDVTSVADLYARVAGPFLDSGWVPVAAGETRTEFVAGGLPLGFSAVFTAYLSADGETWSPAYDASSVMTLTAATASAAAFGVAIETASGSVRMTIDVPTPAPSALRIAACAGDLCVDVKPADGVAVAILHGLVNSSEDIAFSLTEVFAGGVLPLLPSDVEVPAIKATPRRYDRGGGLVPDLVCDEGQVKRGVECWEKPAENYDWTTPGGLLVGKVCPEGTRDSGTTCYYDRGVGSIPPMVCPAGQVKRGAECFDPPGEGRAWTTPGGLIHGKICPVGTKDSGVTCYYDRGAGTVPPLTCPAGQEKRGVECYDPPGPNRDWISPGALEHGDLCPPNTTSSGRTCWYTRSAGLIPGTECNDDEDRKGAECYEKPPPGRSWTTAGGLQHGITCPSTVNSDGTACWYDRGAGRIPEKRPCAANLRDDGTSCWTKDLGRGSGAGREDYCLANDDKWGTGCVRNGWLWYPRCPAGYKAVGCCLCEPDGGLRIVTPLWQREYCPAGYVKEAGMCYKTPLPGYDCTLTNCRMSKDVKWGTRSDPPHRVCGDGRKLEEGLCYKTADTRPGFNCTGITCDISKNVRWGTKRGTATSNCVDPDRPVLSAGLCYPPTRPAAPDGSQFSCTATICDYSKDLQNGTRRGIADSVCVDPDQPLKSGGLCYPPTRQGYSCAATICDFSKDVRAGNKLGYTRQACGPGKEIENGLCYDTPKLGYKCTATICTEQT